MNKIEAIVKNIENEKNLHLIEFDFNKTTLKMMGLELNENIKIGSKVILTIKSTHMALAKNLSGDISYSNQIKAKVLSINNGKILSSIKLEVNNTILESIITKDSSLRMNIQKDDEVTILLKASELSILELVND